MHSQQPSDDETGDWTQLNTYISAYPPIEFSRYSPFERSVSAEHSDMKIIKNPPAINTEATNHIRELPEIEFSLAPDVHKKFRKLPLSNMIIEACIFVFICTLHGS
jgi:hypothetical protein